MPTCWAPGCRSGYRNEIKSSTTKRHFFKAPSDCEQLELWRRLIPRDGQLLSSHVLCDLHFEEHYIVKKYCCVVNGERLEMDRGKWDLTPNAVPTIFPNCPKYLSAKSRKPRRLLIRSSLPSTVSETAETNVPDSAADEEAIVMEVESTVVASGGDSCRNCRNIFILRSQQYQLKRKMVRQSVKIRKLHTQLHSLMKENQHLKKRLSVADNHEKLPAKMKLIVEQSLNIAQAVSKTGNRFSIEWILDSLLIRCKSTACYKFLRENC